MTTKKEMANGLLEQKELRDNLVSRVDVLDKTKELFLIPSLEMATKQQIADFYETSVKYINKLLVSNRKELEDDGYTLFRGEDVYKALNQKGSVGRIHKQGMLELTFSGETHRFSYKGTGLFPKRAILRVGMLLRDSEVAKEVRTQLLNIEEVAPEEVKTYELDNEKELQLKVGQAFASGDMMSFAEATMELNNYKDRYIKQVETRLEETETSLKESETVVDVLSQDFKKLDKKETLRKLVNTVAFNTKNSYGKVWAFVYSEIMYQTGAVVKNRKKVRGSLLNTLSEKELDITISAITIEAKNNNIDVIKEVVLF